MARRVTIPLETRVDIVPLATCLEFFAKTGNIPTSKSQLVALSVSTLASLLVANKQVEQEPSTATAVQMLENVGLGLRTRGKIPRMVIEGLVKSIGETNMATDPKTDKEEDLDLSSDEEADAIRQEQEDEENDLNEAED